MLVYLSNNKDFFQGNNIDFSLKKGIAKAGGTQQHYNFFNELLKHSLWNETINMPLHDTRAAQALLFLYPINIRVLLSLLFYKEELNIMGKYSEDVINSNINSPIIQLQLAGIIDKIQLSSRLYNFLINLSKDFSFTDNYLSDLKIFLNIKEVISFEEVTLRENITKIFNVFNNNSSFNKKIIEISYNNNRIEAAVAVCNALNYKSVGTNLILQAIEKWQNQYLNI